jgi:hypothetical protein
LRFGVVGVSDGAAVHQVAGGIVTRRQCGGEKNLRTRAGKRSSDAEDEGAGI